MSKWLAAAAALAVALPLALVLLVVTTSRSRARRARLWPAARASRPWTPSRPPTWRCTSPPRRPAPACRGRSWRASARSKATTASPARPACTPARTTPGAEGPMQFEPATFAQYAVNADPPAPLTPYDPADAIYTAAAMLCATGAASGTQAGIRQAIFAYNHSQAYVTDVLAWAARYTDPAPSSAAATAIAFAVRQVGKPYQWGATGPDAYDCSGPGLRRLRRRGHPHRPHHLPVAPGRPPDSAVPDPARRPAVLRRLRRHPRQPGPRRDVPRRRPDHPGPADRRGRPDRPPEPGRGRRRPPVPPTSPMPDPHPGRRTR